MQEINEIYLERLNILISDSTLKLNSSERTEGLIQRHLEVYDKLMDKIDDLPKSFTASIFALIRKNYNEDEKEIIQLNKIEFKESRKIFKQKLKALKKFKRSLINDHKKQKRKEKKELKTQLRIEFWKKRKEKRTKKKSQIKPGQ